MIRRKGPMDGRGKTLYFKELITSPYNNFICNLKIY